MLNYSIVVYSPSDNRVKVAYHSVVEFTSKVIKGLNIDASMKVLRTSQEGPLFPRGHCTDYVVDGDAVVYSPLPTVPTPVDMAAVQRDALLENVARSMPASLADVRKLSADDQAKLLYSTMQALAALR